MRFSIGRTEGVHAVSNIEKRNNDQPVECWGSASQKQNELQRRCKMLVLSRKKNQSIVIDGGIEIQILQLKGGTVKIGIKAPNDVRIVRGELDMYSDMIPMEDHQRDAHTPAGDFLAEVEATENEIQSVPTQSVRTQSVRTQSVQTHSADTPGGSLNERPLSYIVASQANRVLAR